MSIVDLQQLQGVEFGRGFIAALDQSGGSTPRALALYGVPEQSYCGDREILVLSPHVGEPNRDGEVLEVCGADGAPPYLIQWADTGHTGPYYPGTDAGDPSRRGCRRGQPGTGA